MQATVRKPLPVVLVLTRPLDAEQREVSKDAGIVRTVLKPYRRSSLFEALQEAIVGLATTRSPSGAGGSESDLKARKLRILVAEDNAMNQRLIVRILEKMGHEVVVADDGRRALEKLTQGEFDLVAMDMQMPVMDGLETTREIRSREQASGRHMPIVAMTANAFEEDRRKCFEAGMDGYVVKPVSAAGVRQEIDRVMAKLDALAGQEAVPGRRQ
jgi:two-component system, sensor histidine kinase and response regulator